MKIYLQKRKYSFYARIIEGSGANRHSRYVSLETLDRRVATKKIKDLECGVNLGDYDMVTSDYIDRFVDAKKHLKTCDQYSIQLRAVFRDMGLLNKPLNVSSEDITSYLYTNNTWSSDTRGYKYRILRAFFNYLIQQGYIKASPIKDVDRPKRSKIKTTVISNDSDIEKLFDAFDQYHADQESTNKMRRSWQKQLWFKPAVMLIVSTGCRRNQIERLTWGDFEPDYKGVWVEAIKFEKSDKVFYFIKHQQTKQLLSDLRRVFPEGYVFQNKFGDYIRGRTLYKYFKKYAKLAGLHPDRHIHGLRHKSVTDDLKNGVDPYLVSQQHKHTSVDFTIKNYAHLNNKDLIDGYSKTYR